MPGVIAAIQTFGEVTVNLIDFGMNIAEAVAAPRIFHGWMPDETLFQNGVTTLDSRKLYEAIGHKIVVFKGLFGPAMGICIDYEKRLLLGAADPRSADGLAAGF